MESLTSDVQVDIAAALRGAEHLLSSPDVKLPITLMRDVSQLQLLIACLKGGALLVTQPPEQPIEQPPA